MPRCSWLPLCVAVTALLASAARAERPFIYTGEVSRSAPAASADASAPAAPAPLPAWPALIGENFSSPMFFDLDGNGVLEVITTDRQLTYVFAADGSLWPGWPRSGGSDNIPAVADIDEDGAPEIFVASPGAPPRIRCFNSDGTMQAGFPVALPYQNWLNVTCPAVADVDGDGHLDVGAQTEGGVAFFDRFGQALPGWPYLWQTTQNIAWSGPAVADLDDDGKCEVVVGNNCLYNCSVHVIRADGSAMPGWPRTTRNIFASPAVGDLDGDGDLEIVIQEGDPTWYGNRMHVWHHDGSNLAGWPIEIAPEWESSRSNPAIVDVDGNGSLEIVAHTGDGMLHILDPDASEWKGYPRLLPDGSIASVQVIDSDADGIAEFFLCYHASGSQWVSGWRLDGTTLAGFPKLLFANSQHAAHSSAHLVDLEGDGDLDLCAQGGTFGAGQVWVYAVDGSSWQEQPNRLDWPKIRRDTGNTGYCPSGTLTAVAAGAGPLLPLRCYPNPVPRGGSFSLGLSAGRGERIAVFDVAGRRLGSAAITGGPELRLSIPDLFETDPPAGVYLLRIEDSGGSCARLVILD